MHVYRIKVRIRIARGSCLLSRVAISICRTNTETMMAGAPTRKKKFRSQEWFDNPDNPGMTALYLERYLNYGLTRAELMSGKPLIGIAQTGSGLSACNR